MAPLWSPVEAGDWDLGMMLAGLDLWPATGLSTALANGDDANAPAPDKSGNGPCALMSAETWHAAVVGAPIVEN